MNTDFVFDDTLDNQEPDARYLNDQKLHKTFRKVPILNHFKSTEAGRPVFDEVDYITIRTPGSQLCTIDAPITAGTYLKRFRKEYDAWKAGQSDALSGTPLESFPFLLGKVALIAELKALSIHTVEQLAEVPDGNIQRIMGGNSLRQKAQDYIKGTSGVEAMLAKMNDEILKANTEKQAMQAQLDQLMTMMGKPEAAQKRTAKET
jgi:hypothetical protein